MWILKIKQGYNNSIEFKFNEDKLHVAMEFIADAAETITMPAEFVLTYEEGEE